MAVVGIYATGVAELRRALREFTPAVRKSFDRRLKDIARSAADDARARASWSKKIPPGITSGATNRGPYIRYRGTAPTIGRLDELRAAWRHPLFGDRMHWYAQRGRKFLQPAAEAKGEVLERDMWAAVEDAKREVEL